MGQGWTSHMMDVGGLITLQDEDEGMVEFQVGDWEGTATDGWKHGHSVRRGVGEDASH